MIIVIIILDTGCPENFAYAEDLIEGSYVPDSYAYRGITGHSGTSPGYGKVGIQTHGLVLDRVRVNDNYRILSWRRLQEMGWRLDTINLEIRHETKGTIPMIDDGNHYIVSTNYEPINSTSVLTILSLLDHKWLCCD